MHKFSRMLVVASGLALSSLIAACGDEIEVTETPVPGTVQVAPDPATVPVGQNITFVATLNGAAVGQTVTWSVANTATASIQGANTGATVVVRGNAAGTTAVTATTANGNSHSATLTVTAAPVVTPTAPATVAISAITQGGLGNPVQLNDVQGQIDVTLNLDRGQQRVDSVRLLVGGVVCATQRFTAASLSAEDMAAAIEQITLSCNTAAFNTTTGAVSWLNGARQIQTQIFVNGSNTPIAGTNSISVELNNQSGFYITQTTISGPRRPGAATRGVSATSPAGTLWWQAGTGIEVVTVPVMYAGDVITSRTLQFRRVTADPAVLGTVIGTRTSTKAGVATDTIPVGADVVDSGRVVVSIALAGGNELTLVQNLGFGVINAQIVSDANSARAANSTIGTRLPALTRVDSKAPTVTFTINSVTPDNWVNANYNFLTTAGALTGVTDDGVGLATTTSPFGAVLEVSGCGSSTFVALSPTTGAGLAECATDLTNAAYTGRVRVVDRLGNEAVSATRTFGVDKTAPTLSYLSSTQEPLIVRRRENESQTSAAQNLIDSVFHNVANTYTTVNSTNAVFGVRYTDERSGFSTVASTFPLEVRITRLAPSGTSCALGGVSCAFLRFLGATELDPIFRRSTFPVYGNLTSDTPGYYTFEARITDRAGNQTTIVSGSNVVKRAAIDITAPQITGISVPAIMTGGQTVAFTPTGIDDLEVISGQLHLNYPGWGMLTYTRQSIGMVYDAPWNTTLSAIVGPGALFGSAGLTINNFIANMEMVSAADSAPVNTAPVKPDAVSAELFDLKAFTKWASAADTVTAYTAAMSGTISVPIFAANVSNPTPWFGRSGATALSQFFVVGLTATNQVTVRVTGPTVAVNPPFASMIVTRWNATTGMWEVVPATVSGPSVNDQGATRFYSYTFTYSGASNAAAGQAFGMGHVALVAGQMIRIIGLDGAGNAISTQTFTL